MDRVNQLVHNGTKPRQSETEIKEVVWTAIKIIRVILNKNKISTYYDVFVCIIYITEYTTGDGGRII